MMIALLAAALISTGAPQDGTIAPDRATWEDLVRCAGVFGAASTLGGTSAPDPAAGSVQEGFRQLAYLYAAPLEIEREATGTEMREAQARAEAPIRNARTIGRLQQAREALDMDQRLCMVVLQRVSGTS